MLRRLGVADDPGHYQPNLQACLEAVLEQSPVLIEGVLAGLQQALVPVQGREAAAANEPLVRKTIALLQEQAPALKQSFSEHLRTYVFGGQSLRHAARQQMRFEDFQFLDSDQIDANIEFAQSQQTVLLAVHDVLPMLNAMVSHLLGWSTVLAHLNPLKPDTFVHALREALEEVVPNPAARATVMSLASGLLGVGLHHLYKEVTDWLRSQGVEPVHMSTASSSSLWNPDNAAHSTVVRTQLTLDRLRRLLTGELDPNPSLGGRVDFSHTIPASFEALQDMKLVEPMMKRLSDRASKTVAAVRKMAEATPAMVDMLAEDLPAQRKLMGVQLGREVVLLMLDNLAQDTRLMPAVRSSIRSLEPVLLALSEQDGRLFSERQHPARLFLDRLTHRSLAYATPDAPGYAHFQHTVDVAVAQVLAGAGDAAAFRLVLRGLDDAWGQEDAQAHQRAGLAARSLLHAEQRNLLAQRLGQEFSDQLQGLKVPSMVAAFLRGPWAQVVAHAQLSLADGSVDPGGYRALVDDLVWSVQLRLTRRNRARLVQMVPDMLVKMRRGLELISYPPQRMQLFFDALISFHEQVFDSTRAPQAPIALEAEPEPSAASGAGNVWIVDEEAADSGYMDEEDMTQPADTQAGLDTSDPSPWNVDSLVTGTWVDLALGGNWVRAQLTWASPQRTLFMFISGSGMAHSMSARTIERLKKSRLIRTVSDGRIMDNALDAVAQTALQNDLLRAKPKARN